MKKALKYRMYPTKKQKELLDTTLKLCCWLCNAAINILRSGAGLVMNQSPKPILFKVG